MGSEEHDGEIETLLFESLLELHTVHIRENGLGDHAARSVPIERTEKLFGGREGVGTEAS